MTDDRWRLSTAYRIPIKGPAKLDVRRYAGRLLLLAATHMGRVSYLVLEIFRAIPEWRIWLPRTSEQAYQVGVGSLFIVLLTAGFAGGVTSLQAGYQFTGTIPVYFAAGVITQSPGPLFGVALDHSTGPGGHPHAPGARDLRRRRGDPLRMGRRAART
jgi:hypothetical protein